MRIILMGQQAFGKATLEAYLDRGEDVLLSSTAPPTRKASPLTR